MLYGVASASPNYRHTRLVNGASIPIPWYSGGWLSSKKSFDSPHLPMKFHLSIVTQRTRPVGNCPQIPFTFSWWAISGWVLANSLQVMLLLYLLNEVHEQIYAAKLQCWFIKASRTFGEKCHLLHGFRQLQSSLPETTSERTVEVESQITLNYFGSGLAESHITQYLVDPLKVLHPLIDT